MGDAPGWPVLARVPGGAQGARLLYSLPDTSAGLRSNNAAPEEIRSGCLDHLLGHPSHPTGSGNDGGDVSWQGGVATVIDID